MMMVTMVNLVAERRRQQCKHSYGTGAAWPLLVLLRAHATGRRLKIPGPFTGRVTRCGSGRVRVSRPDPTWPDPWHWNTSWPDPTRPDPTRPDPTRPGPARPVRPPDPNRLDPREFRNPLTRSAARTVTHGVPSKLPVSMVAFLCPTTDNRHVGSSKPNTSAWRHSRPS